MNKFRLSNKLLLATGCIFIGFFIASIFVFYKGQTRLTIQEMDHLLENESLTISTLVNISRNGELDFEFSKQFLPQYGSLKLTSFFLFYKMDGNSIIQESLNAPTIPCDLSEPYRSVSVGSKSYRILSYKFTPMPEIGNEMPAGMVAPDLCLVLGTDARPYEQLVIGTIYSTLPYLLAIFIASLVLLSTFIRRVTADLNALTRSLAAADFSSTRSFPSLPEAHTIEVAAIVEKLAVLHKQAAQVYEDMVLFIARAAHQLKTPVAAIQATLEVLVRKERTKDELLLGLSDLGIGVKQMSQLTQKLISSTRITFETTPDLTSLDLNRFFEQQWKLFQYQAKAKGIVWNVQNKVPSLVQADEYLLSEIFGNLIENAILYSHAGGAIRISWEQKEGATIIQIADQGPGFPIDVQKNLFEPFHRGDERLVGGSGLGLSIVRTAVHSLGGKVDLIRTSPEGSIMQVILASAQSS